jgi:hypothetical protein
MWILDEAQLSYDDGDIWGSFIKNQHGRYGNGPRICVFSSYGSPSTAIEELSFGPGSPPIHLGPGQRVSIAPSRIQGAPPISLFYTREEYDDVVSRICNDYECPIRLHLHAVEYIFSLTSGHPGAVEGILSMLKKVCFRKSTLVFIISSKQFDRYTDRSSSMGRCILFRKHTSSNV